MREIFVAICTFLTDFYQLMEIFLKGDFELLLDIYEIKAVDLIGIKKHASETIIRSINNTKNIERILHIYKKNMYLESRGEDSIRFTTSGLTRNWKKGI